MNELGSVGSFICPFTMQDLRIGSSVFSDFLHEVRDSESKKSSGTRFLIKSPDNLGGHKELIHMYIFSFKIIILMVLWLAAKATSLGKN